jgi:hypothetical protein
LTAGNWNSRQALRFRVHRRPGTGAWAGNSNRGCRQPNQSEEHPHNKWHVLADRITSGKSNYPTLFAQLLRHRKCQGSAYRPGLRADKCPGIRRIRYHFSLTGGPHHL